MKDVICDFCGEEMEMPEMRHFICKNCGQDTVLSIIFGDFLSTKAILYPSRMSIYSNQFRKDYMPWKYKQHKSRCMMKFYCKEIDGQQKDEFIERLDREYSEWFDNNPKKWWHFWLDA